MRELLLGGEGLIGAALGAELRRMGHQTVSLDLRSGYDLRFAEMAPFLDCDRVWFLAWDTGGAKYIESRDSQHETYRHNSELSAHVFDLLAHPRKPFVFATSQLAGQPNAYGLTKLLAENWAAHLGGQIARFWNVYGWEEPGRKSHVMTDLVLSGLTEGRVRCLTTGAERRRLLYKTDSALALIALAETGQPAADIAGESWLTVGAVAREVARQLGVPVVFGERVGSEALLDPKLLLPSWRPRVSLEEGVAKVIAEARAHLAARPAGAAGSGNPGRDG
jgi:nucleoside-diphosphate-sugar epimerase